MARKKKSPKNLPPEANKTTTAPPLEPPKEKECNSAPGSPPLCDNKKRGSFDDLMLQQTPTPEQKFQQYQSDSELMALKQKLNLEKNKSNLFLIKSYSFIDRTNNKRPLKLQKQKTLPESELDLRDSKETKESKKKSKNKSNTKLEDKPEKLEKPKKPPKLKKIKKSKSTYDSTENLQDLQDLLRKPSIILEDEEHKITPRPQSMPVTQSGHRVVTKAKTLDDIETPRLKRDSFLRHSLQSIRRSFSSSKKHANNISITSSSSSSNSSSASSNSSAIGESLNKRSKSKSNRQKDIANLQDVEDHNYIISVEEKEQPDGCLHSCHNNLTVKEQNTLKSSNSCSLYNTLDPLTVLREEDEKEVGMESNNNNLSATCTNITQRSTSSVSTLAQLPPDSLSPMAPLQTHTECQSVQCLNILDKDYHQTSSTSLQNSNNNNTASTSSSSSPPQKQKRGAFQHQLSIPESLQSQSIGCATSSEYTSARSLKNSATSLTPLPSLNSSGSLRSISPSRPSSLNNSNSTAKHEQQSTAAASAAAAAAAAAGSQQTSSTSTSATTNPSLTISSSSSNGSSSSSSAITATATTANATSMGASSASVAGMGQAGGTTTATTPPEKEKKRKEISSSRVKKFHRHFAQVSKDEKLINYFSCALVSDILLQGHLYITDQHFAFYSNVFGYVTKVVIPTSSVTKISKEKTAKIIPNAVGVATADERHVFGSFISREAAFRLMCSVCPPLGVPEILPKDPANIEITEEYSIEDDSSCSISGNESPAQITELQNGGTGAGGGNNLTTNDANQGGGQTILRRSGGSSNLSINEMRHSDIPKTNAKLITAASSTRSSAPPAPAVQYINGQGKGGGGGGGGGPSVNLLGLKTVIQPALNKDNNTNGDANSKLTIIAGCASSTTSATSTPTPSTSSSPTTVMTPGLLPNSKSTATAVNSNSLGGAAGGSIAKIKQRVEKIFGSVNKKFMLHLKFPTEIHVVYLGVMLTLLLSLFSIFLLYRILDIEAKTNIYRSPSEFNWRSGNDDDIFTEALRFQQQLQLKSTEEAQNILKTNLEQIAKVRRSLETLSMLIHDRSSSFVSNPTDDSD